MLSCLLQGNLCALSLKLGLQILSLFLGNALLYNLGSAINNFLSLLQTKTSCLTNNLDNLNLVRTNLSQLYVELGLLLNFLSCTSSATSYNNTCSCRYTYKFI